LVRRVGQGLPEFDQEKAEIPFSQWCATSTAALANCLTFDVQLRKHVCATLRGFTG